MNKEEEKKTLESIPEVEGSNYNYFWVCGVCHGYIKWGEIICPHCKVRLNWK